MDESRIGQYSISVTTYPIMALVEVEPIFYKKTRDIAHVVEEQSYLQKKPSQFLTLSLCIIDGFLRDLVRGYCPRCFEGYQLGHF